MNLPSKEPGWMLPQLIELDDQYQGRYQVWRHALETGDLLPIAPTTFLAPGDPGFDQTLRMVKRCLDCVDSSVGVDRTLGYIVELLLFALGHPSQPEPPIRVFAGQDPESRTLLKTLDLSLLIRCPADYWGHLLATTKYGTEVSFYPTLQPVARTMATTAIAATRSSHKPAPYQGYDPCMGTGRLSLELSNYCHSLVGWERDQFLIKVATLNFVLYAPAFAYPIPELGGDLIRGNTLSGIGESVVRPWLEYSTVPVPPLPTLKNPVQAKPAQKPKKTKEPADADETQLILF
jgi:hypothetical protein